MKAVPGHLVVLCGGPAGGELGQDAHRLGARAKIVESAARLVSEAGGELGQDAHRLGARVKIVESAARLFSEELRAAFRSLR